MKRQNLVGTLLCFLLLSASAPVVAEEGYFGSFKRDFEFSTGRLLQLAEAIPADKFSWRPTDEVRTVSEVFIHVATANFFIASALGVEMPEDFSNDAEKTITKKDDVIATLKKSIEHVMKAAEKKAGADLEEKMQLFGGERSVRDTFMIFSGHAHEHLGQGIAYARMAGVVPPWSAGGGGGSN